MLPPVAAVSATIPVAQQREVLAAEEVLANLSVAPDDAVALSLAVSSGVEGKLNMLLIAARERMVDSLFAVIDAVSQSLALSQEAGESNAVYALRLADAITDLPPKQMVALQQQLVAQGQTAPLSLVAAALHDPTGTQAGQLVAYLEVVRYKDKDLATKSVVASYGQNDGSTEPEAVDVLATPPRAAQAQAAATVGPTTVSQSAPTPAPIAAAATPGDLADASQEANTVQATALALEDGQSPLAQGNQPAASAGNPSAAARAGAAVVQALETIAPELAAQAAELPAEAATPPGEQSTPRVILQIRSDLKEGLKAVFDQLVQATGTELLQSMAEAEPIADKMIAQALIADMIDSTELNGMPDTGKAAERTTTVTNALPISLTAATVVEELALPLAVSQPPADTPEPAQTVVVPQQPALVPPGLVVAFVTTPYAPAEDAVETKDAMRIDRVDAVDDDEHAEPGKQQQQHQAPGDEPETGAEEVLDMLAAEPDSLSLAAEEPPASRSSLIALPSPATEPLPNTGYDLYERMGA